MADFFSRRFGKDVWLTRHARQSMRKRNIDQSTVELLVETGEIKRKDGERLWIYTLIEGRSDNLMCAAAIESDAVVVKTVMIHWQLDDET